MRDPLPHAPSPGGDVSPVENAGATPVGHLRLALVLTVAGICSALLLIPYLRELMPDLMAEIDEKSPIPLPVIILLQTGIYFTIGSYVGLRAGYGLGLDAPLLRAALHGRALPTGFGRTLGLAFLIGGGLGAVALAIASVLLPMLPTPIGALPADSSRWKGFLASFYGGIGEEIFSRLFVMTVIVWLASKVFARGAARAPAWVYASGAMLAGFLFAAGHLGAAAQIWPLTPLVLTYIFLANMVVGVPLGFIYWKRGLEAAMVAHFGADMVLHVIAAK
jgi:hypothetical protein